MRIDTEASAGAHKPVQHVDSWVYFNGEFKRYQEARIGLMTHALHYGTGVFEGLRAYWNPKAEQLFLLQGPLHYERLRRSGRVLRMELPHTTEELVNLTLDLLRRNQYRTDVYIRPLLYKSTEEIGVRLHNLETGFFIYTSPFGNYVEIEGGIRCQVSSWRRVSDSALPARAKITGAYANSALAKTEAVENGYDEAIVLTMEGNVSEGSAENLFMVKDGAFVTPAVTDDILEGVTRKLIIRIVRDELGLQVVERSVDRTELYTCDELFLCGTGAQIAPVVEVDHRQVGDGKVGELTQELQHMYFAACRGESAKHGDWTIPVY